MSDEIPDLLYSDAERALSDALASLLADRGGLDKTLARVESAQTYDDKLWEAVAADLGCAGLLIPERDGGAGASYREAAAAAEVLGSYVAPVPFLGSAVVATAALLSVAEGMQASTGTPFTPAKAAADLLAKMADGGVTAALAVPFATAPGSGFPASIRVARPAARRRRHRRGAAARDGLRGRRRAARRGAARPGRRRAARVLPGRHGRRGRGQGAGDLARHDQAAVRPVVRRRAGHADRVRAGRLAGAGCGPGRRAGILAAEQTGLAQRCLDMTVAYVKERKQFARPVGSFQGLKHRLADLWVSVTQARAASRYAAACLATGSADAKIAVALAKAYCSEVAVQAAQECVQMHGGIGFTWEHPAHLFLKRAKADSIAFGTADAHRAALASLVDLPAS